MPQNKNRVIQKEYKQSSNFYQSDLILRNYIQRRVSKEGMDYMLNKWTLTGEQAAQIMDPLSLQADKNPPELVQRNFWGEDIDEIRFHPSYQELLNIAVRSEMFRVKWHPQLRSRFSDERHRLGFVSGYLYALSEIGQYCPLCMTDGVARLIDRYARKEDQERLLPRIATDELENLYTGAMFLTEKSGGSDVGRNLVQAQKIEGNRYTLSGEKWFCSNVNAEIIFALARTDSNVPGTKGLSIFMIEKKKADGSPNPLPIVRLKDKLGVKSMASAECVMENTEAQLIGEEFKGFKIMTDMINLSRLYNSVAALSGARRALVEAYTFNLQRESFGQTAINHTLIRDKFYELGALNVANFYLTWNAIEHLDASDQGNKDAQQLTRLLTPMVKKWSAEQAVYIVRESMELMGGIGYIEDGVLPKIMRDVMVLPIWEGAGNIMTLDMLRASFKSEGLPLLLQEISKSSGHSSYGATIADQLKEIQSDVNQLKQSDRESLEFKAKYLFEQLTTLYQLHLIIRHTDKDNQGWMHPTAQFLHERLLNKKPQRVLRSEEIKALIGWEI